MLSGVVDKGFISTRAGTKGKAVEVALLYVEVENDGSGVVVSGRLISEVPERMLIHIF